MFPSRPRTTGGAGGYSAPQHIYPTLPAGGGSGGPGGLWGAFPSYCRRPELYPPSMTADELTLEAARTYAEAERMFQEHLGEAARFQDRVMRELGVVREDTGMGSELPTRGASAEAAPGPGASGAVERGVSSCAPNGVSAASSGGAEPDIHQQIREILSLTRVEVRGQQDPQGPQGLQGQQRSRTEVADATSQSTLQGTAQPASQATPTRQSNHSGHPQPTQSSPLTKELMQQLASVRGAVDQIRSALEGANPELARSLSREQPRAGAAPESPPQRRAPSYPFTPRSFLPPDPREPPVDAVPPVPPAEAAGTGRFAGLMYNRQLSQAFTHAVLALDHHRQQEMEVEKSAHFASILQGERDRFNQTAQAQNRTVRTLISRIQELETELAARRSPGPPARVPPSPHSPHPPHPSHSPASVPPVPAAPSPTAPAQSGGLPDASALEEMAGDFGRLAGDAFAQEGQDPHFLSPEPSTPSNAHNTRRPKRAPTPSSPQDIPSEDTRGSASVGRPRDADREAHSSVRRGESEYVPRLPSRGSLSGSGAEPAAEPFRAESSDAEPSDTEPATLPVQVYPLARREVQARREPPLGGQRERGSGKGPEVAETAETAEIAKSKKVWEKDTGEESPVVAVASRERGAPLRGGSAASLPPRSPPPSQAHASPQQPLYSGLRAGRLNRTASERPPGDIQRELQLSASVALTASAPSTQGHSFSAASAGPGAPAAQGIRRAQAAPAGPEPAVAPVAGDDVRTPLSAHAVHRGGARSGGDASPPSGQGEADSASQQGAPGSRQGSRQGSQQGSRRDLRRSTLHESQSVSLQPPTEELAALPQQERQKPAGRAGSPPGTQNGLAEARREVVAGNAKARVRRKVSRKKAELKDHAPSPGPRTSPGLSAGPHTGPLPEPPSTSLAAPRRSPEPASGGAGHQNRPSPPKSSPGAQSDLDLHIVPVGGVDTVSPENETLASELRGASAEPLAEPLVEQLASGGAEDLQLAFGDGIDLTVTAGSGFAQESMSAASVELEF